MFIWEGYICILNDNLCIFVIRNLKYFYLFLVGVIDMLCIFMYLVLVKFNRLD